MKKGGYIIIDLQSASLVNDLAKALEINKPVLVYDDNNDANFYTLSYDGDNEVYTLTGATGGYTINASGEVTPVVSGGKLYKHYVTYQPTSSVNIQMVLIEVLSKKSTALTFAEILASAYSVCGTGVYDGDLYPANISIEEDAISVDFIFLNNGTATKATDSFTAEDGEILQDSIIEI